MTGPAALEPPCAPPSSIAKGGSRHTLWFLVAFYALGVVWGIRNVRLAEPSALDVWVPAALSICLGWWAIVDARRAGNSIPLLARPWFFLFAVFVVPGYIVWSRKWWGLGGVILHAALWYLLAAIVMNVGVIATGSK